MTGIFSCVGLADVLRRCRASLACALARRLLDRLIFLGLCDGLRALGLPELMAMMFAVIAAIMSIATMMLPLVTAYDIRVIFQATGQQVRDSLIRIAANAAIQFNAYFGKSAFCTIANTAADQRVYAPLFQNVSQRAMAAAIGVYNGRYLNLSVLYVIDHK